MEFQFIRIEDEEQVVYTIKSAESGEETATFRKQILKRGRFLHPQHPDEYINFDDKLFGEVIRAFEEKAIDNVPIITDGHDESYKNTVGRAVSLEIAPKGLYAIMELADQEIIGKIKPTLSDKKGTIDEVSVSLSSLKKDDGKDYPHTLMHIAIVPHAFYRGMESFEQLAAMVADKLGKEKTTIITTKEETMTPTELLAALKEQGIEVSSLEDLKPKENAEAAVLSRIMAAINPEKDAGNTDEVVSEIKSLKAAFTEELGKRDAKLDAILLEHEDNKATAAVEALVNEGKVIPADKDHYMKLYKMDAEIFASITSNLKKTVDTTQHGVGGGDGDIDPDDMNASTIESELKRLKARAKETNANNKS